MLGYMCPGVCVALIRIVVPWQTGTEPPKIDLRTDFNIFAWAESKQLAVYHPKLLLRKVVTDP